MCPAPAPRRASTSNTLPAARHSTIVREAVLTRSDTTTCDVGPRRIPGTANFSTRVVDLCGTPYPTAETSPTTNSTLPRNDSPAWLQRRPSDGPAASTTTGASGGDPAGIVGAFGGAVRPGVGTTWPTPARGRGIPRPKGTGRSNAGSTVTLTLGTGTLGVTGEDDGAACVIDHLALGLDFRHWISP